MGGIDARKDVKTVQYRAVALDPDREAADHYVGSEASTPHLAHLALEGEWTINDREVILERRTVTETPWRLIVNG